MTRVYLGLGSNTGDRFGNLREAVKRLAPQVRVEALSTVYDTQPVGYVPQPSFLNAVVQGETDLPPRDLLSFVKGIEEGMGRTPAVRYGPRLIDIDILLYGEERVETPELTIPHPRLAERAFVLMPLAELEPHVIVPGLERTVAELAAEAPGLDGVRWYGPLPQVP